MRNKTCFILCLLLSLTIFILSSCHKDIVDPSLGSYRCLVKSSVRYGGTTTDSILGYDTLIVKKGSCSHCINVGGEDFAQDGNTTNFAGNSSQGISSSSDGVVFYNNYDSIVYAISSSAGLGGSSWRGYFGHRIK